MLKKSFRSFQQKETNSLGNKRAFVNALKCDLIEETLSDCLKQRSFDLAKSTWFVYIDQEKFLTR